MEIRAEQKYMMASPRKLRLVADAVRKLSPVVACDYLVASNKRAAGTFLKVLKQALANARNNFKLAPEELVFDKILVNAGPDFRRSRAAAKGMSKPYVRSTVHVTIVLASRGGKEVEAVKSAPKVVKGEVKEKVVGEAEGREVMKEQVAEKFAGGRTAKTEIKKVRRRTTHK